jgi:hypothetical protein
VFENIEFYGGVYGLSGSKAWRRDGFCAGLTMKQKNWLADCRWDGNKTAFSVAIFIAPK